MRFRILAPLSVAILLLCTSCDLVPGRRSIEPEATGGATSTAAPPTSALDREVTPGRSQPSLDRPLRPQHLFDDLVALARDLSRTDYAPPRSRLPSSLIRLEYEAYRGIAFRPESALWRDESPFEVQLFHPGFLYTDPVRIHLVEEEQIRVLEFDADRFAYRNAAEPIAEVAATLPASGPESPGYAGFRIHYPLNSDGSKDEVAVFLGASYFRLLGRGHAHGLSSRGLAVNVAEPDGEEFPDFVAFWLLQPESDATRMTFFGLLDGPSVVGAYRFDLAPGDGTTLEVDTRLFARADVQRLGVAPLTSMYLYGPGRAALFDDFRPQVHDSDGLLMHTSRDEWIWRPLSNRSGVQVTALLDVDPWGFGLVQRDRSFESYLDLEASYHRRPSEWVTMGEGDWGIGSVQLVELPTPSEFNDNIVAFWTPDDPFRAGDERAYRYQLRTFDRRLEDQTLGQVERTLIGSGTLPGADVENPGARRFVVDFRGGTLDSLDAREPVSAALTTSSGVISNLVVQPLPERLGYRATFTLDPDEGQPADMRLLLEQGNRTVSETWTYLWVPERDG